MGFTVGLIVGFTVGCTVGFTVGSVRFKRYLVSIIPVSYSFFCSYLLKAHMFCCILAGRACSQVVRDQHTMKIMMIMVMSMLMLMTMATFSDTREGTRT